MDPVASLFTDIAASQQQFLDRTNVQQEKLKEQVDTLSRENANLRAQNEALKSENSALKTNAGYEPSQQRPVGYGNAAPPPPAAGYTPSPASPGYGNAGYARSPYAPASEYRQVKIIKSHEGPVHSVTMGPTGLLATASWDATVQVYDLTKDDNEAIIVALGAEDTMDPAACQMGGLYGVAFARTAANIIGCASADKNCYLWNYQTGKFLLKLEGHEDEVNGIAFHPTQQVVISSSDDCSSIIWDFQEGMKLRNLDSHDKAVYGATFLSADKEYFVATCCFDQKVRIHDMRDKSIVAILQGHIDDVIGIDFSDKTQMLATGSDDGCICLWDTRKWSDPVFKINSRDMPGIPNNEIKRVCFSHDGRKVAAGCSSQQALIYDVGGPSPAMVAALPGHQDCVFDVCWGIDATGAEYLVDASHDHTSFVWRPV